MKKRTKELLSGILACSIVLRIPADMAAAQTVGYQQEVLQADNEGKKFEYDQEVMPNEMPEEDAENVSELFTETTSDILSDQIAENTPSDIFTEEMSNEISDEKPEDNSDINAGSEPENHTETISDNLSDVSDGKSDIEPAEFMENKSDIESTEILESESEGTFETLPEEVSEKESESSSPIESGQISDVKSEIESEQSPESIVETESEQILENASEMETEQISESMSETESGEWPENELETESEAVPEESTEIESSTEENCADNFDESIYIKEVDSYIAADTEERDISAPVLEELWVESAYHEAANTNPEQLLVKDFVLKGTFCAVAGGVNRIEYTTDLQTEDTSVWLEAGDTQTAESKTSATGFQIALPDGVYPSIAIRAYDGTGNVSAVGQLVNDSGESIKVVVDSTSDIAGMTTQDQSAAITTVKKTLKLKTTNPEASKSGVTTNPEISNPEISNPEISNPEISNPEISNPEIPNLEILNPETQKQKVIEPEVLESEVINSENLTPGGSKPEIRKPEILKPEILTLETSESKDIISENTNKNAVNPEMLETGAPGTEIAKIELSRSEVLKTVVSDSKPELKPDISKSETVRSDSETISLLLPENSESLRAGTLLSDWTSENDGHYATFEFSEDGEYSIAANGSVLEKQTEAFIIDRIAPKMTVDLVPAQKTQSVINAGQNSTVQNDSFNTKVTAVIRVTEHNFREEDFMINMTSVSEKGTWSHDGDVHTLRIPFDEDDAYHIECTYADPYGNSAKTVKKDFLIDTAAPAIVIEGVENNSANNSAIRPVISITDSNMELSDISVSVMTGTGDLVQSAIDTELVSSENGTGYRLTLTDISEQPDNVYHLLVSACDKAGNVAERTYRFSLNRNGSVYDLTSLRQLMDQKYSTYSALGDIQIVEMNMDAVEEFDLYISRNGALGYKADYTKEIRGSADTGYTYLYQIKKENFAEEGTYRLTMYSRDKAGNEVNNATDINGEEITFVVDNTAPKVVIDGVESGMVYKVEGQKVHITVMDNFKLDEAEFILVNEANEVLERWDYIALAGEDGALDITIPQHNGKLSLLYQVKDATGNEIRVLCEDVASPVDFTVNANQYMAVSHKFWIGFMAVLTVISISVLTQKKRKSHDKVF